ncbi:hypothetical protein [Enterobacter cloacae]|uniref:hypothetical protein n=1 Tax=Enterobacter cloacae TaxID=550 RepID=UPI002B1FAD4E|nr:hypothetical protein [Enterobacter cloacae]MEA5215284.1 hypothetical protein [Enterobacter cloacae]
MIPPVFYGSVCSGIEAASLALHCMGWQPAWFAEIEKSPSAALAYRWPDVTELDNLTKPLMDALFEEVSHLWDSWTSIAWGETGLIIIDNIGEKNA